MTDIVVKSTKAQLEEFKESLIWKDFVAEIERLSDALTAEYDLVGERQELGDMTIYPTTAEVLLHVGDIKGRKKALQYFLSLPDVLISLLEVTKDDSKRK